MSTPKPESRQDCFYVYRKNVSKPLGYEMIRKKVGIKPEFGFDDVKKHIKDNAQEDSDKLKNGDIVVIRRPSEDMNTIISEAAVYTDGALVPDNARLEDLEMSEIQEMPPKGFNVYDDIKDKLIAKGVPEEEIAFIHDYDTAEKKQKLFDKMNAGEVRILLGSTSKCGAGMNAQRKMIALHHLDCPLRPSDVGQSKRNILEWLYIRLCRIFLFCRICFICPVHHRICRRIYNRSRSSVRVPHRPLLPDEQLFCQ
jgi:hypothetical protein